MITAIIRNKENTLVLELPHSIYDIYEKLRSIGIMQPPKQIPLTDNEDEDIGVKLFSESDFGRHLLLTLNEKNSIADANMLTLVIGAASEDIKEELEQNILYDQYDSMDEVINAVRQMTQDAGPVKAVFFCPLIGNIDEGDGDMFTVGDSYLADSADDVFGQRLVHNAANVICLENRRISLHRSSFFGFCLDRGFNHPKLGILPALHCSRLKSSAPCPLPQKAASK